MIGGKSLRLFQLIGLIGLFAGFLAACGGPKATPSQATPAPPAGAPVGRVAEGKKLFTDKGCIACHKVNGEGGAVGSSLAGIAGKQRELATGQKVTADHEYLEESIENPNAKIVKGFTPGVMPQISLTHDQVDALIDFITSLK